MIKNNKLVVLVVLATLFTAIIYLYPLLSFQKLTTTYSYSNKIPIFNQKNLSVTLTTNYNSLSDEYLINVIKTNQFGFIKQSNDYVYKNKMEQPISLYIVTYESTIIHDFVFGAVNDQAIKNLHYVDHAGAVGHISFLDHFNFNNKGQTPIEHYPQLFVIKTPFKNGILLGQQTDGTVIFESNISLH